MVGPSHHADLEGRRPANGKITRHIVKKRVVLPAARPGDVFDIQPQGEGRILLVRLERPAPGPAMTRARCLQAIAAAPLRMKTTWESLKALTREP